jgi:hypothetical protein
MANTRRKFLQGGLMAAGSFVALSKLEGKPSAQISKHELKIAPSKTSSENDFDFYIGNWKVHNKKLKTRLNHCTEWEEFEATCDFHKILGGMGNTDYYHVPPFEGCSFRLFDPKTRLWTIYWADNVRVALDTPVVGSFENKIGKFFCKDTFHGKEITVQFLWDATDPDHPQWSQAFSPDSGNTWEWNWYMFNTRA